MPANDLTTRLLVRSQIRQCRVYYGVVLLLRSTQYVVELLLVDSAEISIRILENKVTDPVCTDWEWITLAVLVFRITLGAC